MKLFSYAFLIIICVLLQLFFSRLLDIKGIRPDFLLIVVVWIAYREDRFVGTILGFAIGLLQDIFEPQFFGLSALAKSIAGFIAGRPFYRDLNIKYWTGVNLGINSFIHDFIYFNIYYLGTDASIFKTTFRYVIPGSFYTLIIGIIFYNLLPKRYWYK